MPTPAPNDPTEDTAEVKFIVSKQIRSVILHAVVPIVCVIGFNIIRATKPDLLWSADQDQAAIDQLTSLVNNVLIAISGVMAAVGSARDINSFRLAKQAKTKEGK